VLAAITTRNPLGTRANGTISAQAQTILLAIGNWLNVTDPLGSDEMLHWTHDHQGLDVHLPAEKPSEFAFVLRIR